MRKLLVLLCCGCLHFFSHAQTPVEQYGQLQIIGTNLCDQYGNPVQLRGPSSGWLQWDAGIASPNTIEWLVQNWNIDVFRIAMGVEYEGGYLENKTAVRARVGELIEACIQNGIYVIVDWHDHSAHERLDDVLEFFTDIAQTYGHLPNIIYEPYNEPLNVSWDNVLRPFHIAVIDRIRLYDSNNIIVCGTREWSQRVDEAANNPILRDNIMYTIHFYSCTHGAGLRAHGDYALSRGLALFCTEWGATHADGGDDGIVCHVEAERWTDWMRDNNISWAAWHLVNYGQATSMIRGDAGTNASNWVNFSTTTPTNNNGTSFYGHAWFVYSKIQEGRVNCRRPNLGPDLYLCGLESITLNSNLSSVNKTFTWQRDGQVISGNEPSLTVNQAGTYRVIVDSLDCLTSDQIIIHNDIVGVDLGEDRELTGSSILLDAGVHGTGLTYQWQRNGEVLPQTTRTLTVTQEGVYSITVSGAGCSSVSDEVVISLPPSLMRTETPITINGIRDAAYPEMWSITNVLVGSPTESDLSASWTGLWDNTNMYIFVSVTDDDLQYDSGSSWWNDDGIEIFIDGNNSKGTTYDAFCFQFGFVWGASSIFTGANNPSNSTAGIQYSIVDTEQGYDLEVLIPWSLIGINPTIGHVIGFDIGVNDDDGGGARNNKIAWHKTTDDGWENPSVFGNIELVGTRPVASISTDEATEICEGDSVLLIASTGTNYSYQWKRNGELIPGATSEAYYVNQSGDYTVEVTANEVALESNKITVAVNTIPEAPTVTSPIVYEQNQTASPLSANGSNLIWYFDGAGSQGTDVAPVPNTDNVGNFVFYVTQTVDNCESDSAYIELTVQQSIYNQYIELVQGWNLISINVIPSDNSIETLFQGLDVHSIKSTEGFWRNGLSSELQSIQSIVPGNGYLVFMNTAGTLHASGLVMETPHWNLASGWNVIGTPYQNETAFSSVFSDIQVQQIKNFEGFWAPNDINSIDSFEPGGAYFILIE